MVVVAESQDGVISVTQLHEAGFSEDQIRTMVRRGQLHLLFRGVYAVGHRKLSVRGWLIAAKLAAPDGACFSHRTGAERPGEVQRLITKSVRPNQFDPYALEAAIDRHAGRKGMRMLKAAAARVHGPIDSPATLVSPPAPDRSGASRGPRRPLGRADRKQEPKAAESHDTRSRALVRLSFKPSLLARRSQVDLARVERLPATGAVDEQPAV